MKISRKRYFIIGLIIIIALEAFDLVSTWIVTPDLSEEANSFVSWFGEGWVGLILISIGFVGFVAIPFYYHSLVYNYPHFKSNFLDPFSLLFVYLFRSDKNFLISLGKSLFNALGYFLFWWFSISKIVAVVHNFSLLGKNRYAKLSFPEQMEKLDSISDYLLISVMIVFIIYILYKINSRSKSLQSSVRFHPAFGVVFLLLYASFRLFISFAKPIHSVKLITTVDPDIVLVNIGDTDRAGIGKLLLAIDSSQPVLIAVDVLFFGSKGPVQDSVFSNALETTRNDILAYNLDSLGKPVEVQDQFRAFITDQGLMKFERVHYLVSRTKPVRVIDDDIYEDLALKIVKLWKPGFSHRIKKNMSIPIEFRRLLQSFMVFDGIDINDVDPEFLKNKIVLVGYIGPSDGDKFYTPIRLLKYYPPDVPDTYGLVILANEIRTILGYEVKD